MRNERNRSEDDHMSARFAREARMSRGAKPTRLGVVTQGAFNLGLTVRLDPGTSTEGLRIGSFVVVEGERHRYFSLIADMALQAADPRIAANPPRDAS